MLTGLLDSCSPAAKRVARCREIGAEVLKKKRNNNKNKENDDSDAGAERTDNHDDADAGAERTGNHNNESDAGANAGENVLSAETSGLVVLARSLPPDRCTGGPEQHTSINAVNLAVEAVEAAACPSLQAPPTLPKTC